MLVIQIILIVFFVFAILRVGARYRAGDVTGPEAAFWTAFWVVAGAVVMLPDSTFYLARIVGVGRGADLVVYIALVAIFFILFRLMVKQERVNRDITVLTRKIALAEGDKEIKR
jgi:hypothetical protein